MFFAQYKLTIVYPMDGCGIFFAVIGFYLQVFCTDKGGSLFGSFDILGKGKSTGSKILALALFATTPKKYYHQ